MTNPVWAPALWTPNVWPDFPPEPPDPEPLPSPPGIQYNPWEPAVFQHADWTCSCASSAWLLNSIGDTQLGRSWGEWDVVTRLRDVTYQGAVSPNYGLARADMKDLETMFNSLGYSVDRKRPMVRDDVVAIAGRYPLQINGARWYHHSGARAVANGALALANPAPNWKGVGQEMTPAEAGLWGTWGGMWIVGRI
jgi:hypothetical protein